MKRNEKTQRPHSVFVVEGEGDKAFWTKVGAAWAHDDGKGFNIQLSCLPLNGRLVIREPKADAEAGQ
ncbi:MULTISPECIES: hypothetical protein [unclassified Bradyrhizobium]|uniref:hypothetical protein n=1 Tax=unclassified Bradyrhizobium TaxID=2631580 RepID=UPI00211F2DB0|nr:MULTISPECIES: hypothetical protein [unclassified Bradyrhizobium]MDD1532695.1 hypothetical protein [Bradyrhizobium sp. WBOS8]MDD1581607.1 hypothetical protein [Bradyrhizobium sp. WBOS4]UUO49878.1 hypothetical protein DCM78_25005 [Bradyrhizobium sp. WBOS04]UUO58645.1 hypothetical protein DCM80_05285 [Bradyrhizobium sp. WBOS08]